MNNYVWSDSRGASHGAWCREKFYETTCQFCRHRAWYFECSHGCKVFFHKVPWIHGEWNTNCICPNEGSDNFNFNLNIDEGNNFNYILEEEEDFFNYNFED